MNRLMAAVPVPLGGCVIETIGDPQSRGQLAHRLEHATHGGINVAVDLGAHVAADGVDHDEPRVADLTDLLLQQVQVGLQVESPMPFAVLGPHGADDVDAPQVGAGGHQPRPDGVGQAVLGAQEQHRPGRRGSFLTRPFPAGRHGGGHADGDLGFSEPCLAGNESLLADRNAARP